MRQNVTSDVGISTHVNQWWSAVPFVTASIMLTCAAVYFFDLLTGYDSFFQVCSSPDYFVTSFQVYRAFTSVVFHKGILHLGLNMMALYPIASPLERLMGSLRTAHAVLLFAVTNAVIDTGIAYAVKMVSGYPNFTMECGIGFSGIIFSFIVLENHISPGATRSIFGFFSVPSRWYPWVLLLIFQLILPSASFLGHLSGILSGIAYKQGYLSYVIPSSAGFSVVERISILAPVVRRPGFISGGHDITGPGSANGYGLPTISIPSSSSGSPSSLAASLSSSWRGFQAALSQLRGRLQQQQQQQQHRGAGQQSVVQAAFPGGDTSGRSILQSPAGSAPLPGGYPMPAFAPPAGAGGTGPTAQDPRFPGKGRTLTESEAPLPVSTNPVSDAATGEAPQNPAVAAAAAAALARISGRSQGEGLPRVPESMRPPAYMAEGGAEVAGSNAGLAQLLAMGFQKEAAETAIAASNGDVALAVDFLSTS